MTALAIVMVILAMGLVLLRALKGPTVYDRILVANSIGTKTIALIVLMGLLADNPMFYDIALVYALVNFITTIALLKYFRYRSLGRE